MRKLAARLVLLIGSVSAVGLLSLTGVGDATANRPGAQGEEARERIAIRDALRRGGLREAAKVKGHYVEEYDPHWDIGLFDIEALTKGSAAVIVGTPTLEVGARLASGGELIFTDYAVEVGEVIKGEVSPGDTVTVSLVGGHVGFEDGTSAELKTPSFEHVKTGRTYVFFLTEADDSKAYLLTGGPQGLVELSDIKGAKSHGRPTDPVAGEAQGKDKNSFLTEVRKQAKQWPHPGKCCN